MTAIRTFALAAAFTVAAAAAAPAMTVADLANGKMFAASLNPGLGDEMLSGAPTRLDRLGAEEARAAAEAYFDFDALITLGALGLAGGGLAAVAAARRRAAEAQKADAPNWREGVFRALEADLAQFTQGYRRAA